MFKKALIIILFIIPIMVSGKMEFSEPKPSFENPRKWVIGLNTNDLDTVNHTLDAINNVLKEYPMESLKIAVITYSSGIRALKKDYDKKTLSRIRSVMEYDIEFVVCKNTMDTMKWKKEDFIDGVTYIQAGIAGLIERAVGGWIHITPY